MAMQNVFNILVDLKVAKTIPQLLVTQNDSVVFILEVMQDGVPFDLTDTTTVSLAHTRKDQTVVITPGTKVGNKATFALGTNETSVTGAVTAKAQFYDAEGRVSTLSFGYSVGLDPTGSGYEPSASEATLIEVVLNDGPLIIASAEEAAAYANEQGDYALQVGVDNETRYLNAVSSVVLRDSTYPLPAHGDTVRITELGRTDRYVLGTGWVTTDVYNPLVIDELSSQLAEKTTHVKAEDVKFTTNNSRIPLVTIIDDDGGKGLVSKLKVFLDSKGVKGCAAIVTQFLNNATTVTDAEVVTLHNEGWEIMSHGVNHVDLSLYSEVAIEAQLKDSKTYLDNLLNTDVKGVVYPYGAYNSDVLKIAKKHYDYGFAGQGLQASPIDSIRIKRITIGEDEGVTLAWLKAKVDEAVLTKSWLVFNIHVDTTSDPQWQNFMDVIDYVITSNVSVVTASEAIEYFGNVLEINNEENGNYTSITKDGQIFSSNIYKNFKIDYVTGITTTTPLTDSKFATDRLNVSIFYGAENGGFPTSAGTLHTFNPKKGADGGFAYQLWHPYQSNLIYKRYWNFATTTWSAFAEFLPYNLNVESTDNRLTSSLIGVYKSNAVTYTPISGAFASANGFPENKAGMLITEKMNNENGYQRQTYKIFSSQNVYERSVSSVGTWLPFEKIVKSLGKVKSPLLVIGTITAGFYKDFNITVPYLVAQDTLLIVNSVGILPHGIVMDITPIDNTTTCLLRLSNTKTTDVVVADRSFNVMALS